MNAKVAAIIGAYDDAKKTYWAEYRCTNCRTGGEFKIGRGIEAKQFIEASECPNCGMRRLIQRRYL